MVRDTGAGRGPVLAAEVNDLMMELLLDGPRPGKPRSIAFRRDVSVFARDELSAGAG
jgi:hypothetical protein